MYKCCQCSNQNTNTIHPIPRDWKIEPYPFNGKQNWPGLLLSIFKRLPRSPLVSKEKNSATQRKRPVKKYEIHSHKKEKQEQIFLLLESPQRSQSGSCKRSLFLLWSQTNLLWVKLQITCFIFCEKTALIYQVWLLAWLIPSKYAG